MQEQNEIKINDNERVDDLQLNGLKIIQNTNGFCFGIDKEKFKSSRFRNWKWNSWIFIMWKNKFRFSSWS